MTAHNPWLGLAQHFILTRPSCPEHPHPHPAAPPPDAEDDAGPSLAALVEHETARLQRGMASLRAAVARRRRRAARLAGRVDGLSRGEVDALAHEAFEHVAARTGRGCGAQATTVKTETNTTAAGPAGLHPAWRAAGAYVEALWIENAGRIQAAEARVGRRGCGARWR
ncbi:hypothetical protein ESCO_001367 [Escovopsis weberi]|uniref:Uncharacterized protein n=1 Tax=Escovopsis weberi TaxID=150374 RepID=A0A0M9VTP0_ESCWE|nr:hypothetical protein ESCO_001367 [Escovopsis weberi]